MAGYSGTPLVKKLGIKEGFNIVFVNAPKNFKSDMDLPSEVCVNTSATRQPLDFVLLFVKTEKDLLQKFVHLAAKLKPNGMLWVAWPKKSSGVPTDLSFTNVQAIGLDAGLVDVKICAVDETWSGLKFVIRVKDRPRRSI
jgi:DUF3052 family protein